MGSTNEERTLSFASCFLWTKVYSNRVFKLIKSIITEVSVFASSFTFDEWVWTIVLDHFPDRFWMISLSPSFSFLSAIECSSAKGLYWVEAKASIGFEMIVTFSKELNLALFHYTI